VVRRVLVSIALGLSAAWAALARAIDPPWPRLGAAAGRAFAAGCVAWAVLARPWRRAALACAAAVAVVLA
jgi:hypothetical protein